MSLAFMIYPIWILRRLLGFSKDRLSLPKPHLPSLKTTLEWTVALVLLLIIYGRYAWDAALTYLDPHRDLSVKTYQLHLGNHAFRFPARFSASHHPSQNKPLQSHSYLFHFKLPHHLRRHTRNRLDFVQYDIESTITVLIQDNYRGTYIARQLVQNMANKGKTVFRYRLENNIEVYYHKSHDHNDNDEILTISSGSEKEIISCRRDDRIDSITKNLSCNSDILFYNIEVDFSFLKKNMKDYFMIKYFIISTLESFLIDNPT
ncbi:MAG: hypothetical protein HQL56_12615 [Magnetococcales bacterium]|nr:hypothetical protein [Magnetococcales bacterium]